jgi:NAD(P)-dependent dehydrogenase (short-subunit alcohol dehydrogenase family)
MAAGRSISSSPTPEFSAGTGQGHEPAAQSRAIFAVNLDGVLNAVLPLLPAMQARRRGQLALMSSLAGFRGFHGAPAYCASKAAVRIWGESLRGDLRDSGIEVSVICPGYIESPMTARNKFYIPLRMPAAAAARIIRRGLARGAGAHRLSLAGLFRGLASGLPVAPADRSAAEPATPEGLRGP